VAQRHSSPPRDDGLPTLPWHKGPGRRAGKAPLTRERIVHAAIEILDQEGLDAMSTRRVAEALDTGSASLYAHVKSRDELLELVIDQIAADIRVPRADPASWAEQLRSYGQGARAVWSAHGDLTRVSLATIPTGPNRLRVLEQLLAIFRAANFDDQTAVWAIDRLNLYIEADVYEGALHRATDRHGLSVGDYLDSIRDYFRRLPADRFPIIASMADTITNADSERRFEFGLDMLIKGLAAHCPAQSEDG
jgi:AcrR family transcriptional regulator